MLAAAQTQTASASNIGLWIGRILSGLAIAFLLMDGALKLTLLPIVIETSAQLGLPADAASLRGLGLLLMASTLLYAYPRTALLGAILLTGYMGGAIATHWRVGSPVFSHLLSGLYVGLLIWGGLYLRDARLRALFPFRR